MKPSIEVLPREVSEFCDETDFSGTVSSAYIPMIPGKDPMEVAKAAHALAQRGVDVVPHFAARRFDSYSDTMSFLRKLQDAGVTSILLIGGDDENPGYFSSCIEVLNSDLLSDYGIKMVALAGHPEGNPNDPYALANLTEKVKVVQAHNLHVHIVTQLCFDISAINAWIKTVRGKMDGVPIHVSIPGPVNIPRLIARASKFGIKNAARMFKKYKFNLIGPYQPDLMINELEGHDALHIFAFGGLRKTEEWLRIKQVVEA